MADHIEERLASDHELDNIETDTDIDNSESEDDMLKFDPKWCNNTFGLKQLPNIRGGGDDREKEEPETFFGLLLMQNPLNILTFHT